MTKSMTGYGKAECNVAGRKITIEIRSLNSKSFDLNLKLPALYREKESQIRGELMPVIQRGKVDFSVQTETSGQEIPAQVNAGAFKAYYETLQELAYNMGIPFDNSSMFPAILRLPDVLAANNDAMDEHSWDAFFACLQEALKAFDTFRKTEGEMLCKDILHRVRLILQLLEKVEPFEKQRVESIRQRIENSLKEISSAIGYDRNRFEQEMIYYLEKLDITEEKTRLRQHCAHFIATMEKEEAPGRKLGFIAQEMGREINTLGSKANQADIQQMVVQMKDELEKVKEQSLNIL